MGLSTHNNKTTQGWFSDIFFIILSLVFFYSLWIGSYPLFTPDEGRYSEVAREMLTTGDFITPRLNGIAFLDKPALYYWLQAIAIALFGLKEWSLRFWPAFMGVLGCTMVYFAGRILFNRRTGILSAIILATNPLYFGASHYANLDLEVAVFISSTLLFFICAMNAESQRNRTILLLFAYISAALATLTKGLIGIAFPAMIIGAWILLLNRWHMLLKMRLISGVVLFTVIVTPWFFLVQKANPQFYEYFFVLQQFSRFLTKADFNNQATIWFYIPIILSGFLPWTCFLLQSLWQHISCIWQHKQKYSNELFLMLWFLTILVFFSIPKSKTIGYILPTLPALSLMVGNSISKQWNNLSNFSMKFGFGLFILISLMLSAILLGETQTHYFRLNLDLTPHFMAGGLILFVMAIGTYVLFKQKKFIPTFSCIVITASLFLLCIIHSAATINHKSTKPLAAIINSVTKPDDEVITYYTYFQDLPIYIQRRITVVADWLSPDIDKYDNWQRELWYHMHHVDSSTWLIDRGTIFNRWMEKKQLFLVLSNDYYPEFSTNLRRAHPDAKIFVLGSSPFNDVDTLYLVTNHEIAT